MTKGEETVTLCLAPRSMLALSNEARTSWKHEIKPTASVILEDNTIYQKPENYRRLSLTYRTLS